MNSHHHFAHTFARYVRGADRVLLTITKNPDGDSIGSMLAAAHAVRHLGAAVDCFTPDPIPSMFHYLTNDQPIVRDLPQSIHAYPLIVIFDTGDIKRTPLADELIKRNPQKTVVINIDHHPTVTDYRGQSAVDHNFTDTTSAATTELLYKMFEIIAIPLDHHVATSLLTGILTDTNHFANLNTTTESFNIAARLMAKGADHRTITQATMRNKSLGTLQLWGRALSRLKINRRNGVVSTVITLHDLAECQVDKEATTGIANFLNSLGEGKIALVLQEEPGNIVKGSFRTTSDLNVADIAEKFGGGGHAKAAGFTIPGQLVKTKNGWRVEALPLVNNSKV